VRLRPDELGFRGALSFRMSRIFGLLDSDLSIVEAPRAPIPHNVVLGQQVTLVATDALSPELKLLNDREMASWKFSVDYVGLKEKATLRYCLQLSSVRTPSSVTGPIPVCPWSRIELTDAFSWRSVRRGRFFRPTNKSYKETPVFDSVLQTQLTESWCPLPTYGEAIGIEKVADAERHTPDIKERSVSRGSGKLISNESLEGDLLGTSGAPDTLWTGFDSERVWWGA